MHFPGLRPVSCSMNLTMALVGRSEFCKIKPPIRDASRFYYSLLRAPAGVWLVDLLASERVTVNGETHRYSLLNDGDEVRFGGCTLVVRHGPAASPPGILFNLVPSALPRFEMTASRQA